MGVKPVPAAHSDTSVMSQSIEDLNDPIGLLTSIVSPETSCMFNIVHKNAIENQHNTHCMYCVITQIINIRKIDYSVSQTDDIVSSVCSQEHLPPKYLATILEMGITQFCSLL